MNFPKSMFALALGSVCVMQSVTALAVENSFSFNGGSDALDNGLTAPASGSWFSLLAADTDEDNIPDQYWYTSMRAAGTTGTDLSPGTLDFDAAEPINVYAGLGGHNTGNSIDRDWSFLGNWGAHYTNQALEVTWDGVSNTALVSMDGWMWAWNGASHDWGTGTAIINLGGDGLGGGNDTLDYSVIAPSGGFAGVLYTLHLEGNAVLSPVPEADTWAMLLAGLGMVGVAARYRKQV